MRESRRRNTLILLFALFSAVGLLFFTYQYFNDKASGFHYSPLARFIEEMTGAYAALALIPIVVFTVRRFRWTRSTWLAAVLAQIAGAAVYSAAHTTLLAVSRAVIFPIAGLGSYDYGNLLYRYPMEAGHDVVFYAIFAGFVYFFDRMHAARQAELRAAELQTKLAEARLANLRLQLHPHFLFNTLNAISTVMYEDVRKADEMLAKLSDFLRLVLASSDVQQVPIAEEITLERMYVDIMTARLERGLHLNVSVDDGARDALVPFMLLQPLIENSIRHGMNEQRNELDLAIDVRRADDSTIVRVSDDGVGIGNEPKLGIGLTNVESRLQHMYGAQASLTVERREAGGTLATIVFPYSGGASA